MGRGRLAPHAVRQHRSRGRIGRLPVVGARRQRCGDHRSEPVPRQPAPQVRSMAHRPRLDLGAGIRGGRTRCGVVCGRDRLGRRCAGPPRLRLTRWDTVAARSRRIAAIDRRRCRASERGGPPRGDVRPSANTRRSRSRRSGPRPRLLGQPVLRQDVAPRVLPIGWAQRHRQSTTPGRTPGVSDLVRRAGRRIGDTTRGGGDGQPRRRTVRLRAGGGRVRPGRRRDQRRVVGRRVALTRATARSRHSARGDHP